MKTEAIAFLPKARSEGIITKEVDGEVLVYDLARDKAHCLNETAAAIWKLCDGRTTASEMAAQLSGGEGRRQKAVGSEQQPLDERVVWLALEQLRNSHLLEEPNGKTFWPASIPGIANMSRREAVRRIGLGAAIALPIVISMTAPTPAEAAVSCGAPCHPCSTPADCCGVCSNTAVPGCGPTTPRCT